MVFLIMKKRAETEIQTLCDYYKISIGYKTSDLDNVDHKGNTFD